MVAQIIVNASVTGSIYLLVAIAFLVAFRLRGFFDFSFAALILVAPYIAIAGSRMGIPLELGVPVGWLGAALACLGLHKLVFQPLDRLGGSSLEKLLASLGVFIVVQNLIAMVFGDSARNLGASASKSLEVADAHVTFAQLSLIGTALLVVGGLDMASNRTTFGLTIRAIGTDEELAHSYGVAVTRVILIAMGLSGFLAGIAGGAMAFDVAITPTSGLKPLLGGVVAVVVGGGRTIRGVGFVAVILGFAEHFSVLLLGSAWKDAIVFIVLLIFLLMRPSGVKALTERVG